MHISVEPRDEYAILHLRGEFDTYYVPALQQEIDTLMKAGVVRVVLNLRLVKFINSTALGAIIKASKLLSSKGGKLVISRPSAFCRDIIEKVGLDRVVSAFATDEEAGEYLMQGSGKATVSHEHAEDHPSVVLFSPLDPIRIQEFLPPEVHTAKTPLSKDPTPLAWTGAGRMLSLDLERLRFTWNGGNLGLSPAVMAQFLETGTKWTVKFRLPLLKKGYCESVATAREVEVRPDGVKVTATFDALDANTRRDLEQYVKDMAFLKDELKG